MPELEKFCEGDCVEWAEDRGWLSYKIEKANKRGLPDRIFIRFKEGAKRTVWWEFKQVGKEPTEQQKLRHAELREQGHEVYWSDNRQDFYDRMV